MVSDVAEHIRLKKKMALVWDASQVWIEIGTVCGIFQLRPVQKAQQQNFSFDAKRLPYNHYMLFSFMRGKQ